MTDKKYRQIVREIVSSQEHYIYAFLKFTDGNTTKDSIWLKLIGLIETADLTR